MTVVCNTALELCTWYKYYSTSCLGYRWLNLIYIIIETMQLLSSSISCLATKDPFESVHYIVYKHLTGADKFKRQI